MARNLGVEWGEEYARLLRRTGYPEAHIVRHECCDEMVVNSDNLIIQVSIRTGPYVESSISKTIMSAFRKATNKQ